MALSKHVWRTMSARIVQIQLAIEIAILRLAAIGLLMTRQAMPIPLLSCWQQAGCINSAMTRLMML